MRIRQRLWLLVIPILLLTTWLASLRLNITPMWNDEFHSLRDAGGYGAAWKSPDRIWNDVALHNPWHTPGYFILLNGWAQFVGWEIVPLRWLSILIGLLGVAITYRLAHDTISPRAGLYAAATFGTSAMVIDQMQDIRVHVVSATLTALCLWLYLRIIDMRKPVPFLRYVALAGTATAMLYSHYFMAIPLAVIGLYHLVFVPKTRRWWVVFLVLAAAGILFLPWLPNFQRSLVMTERNDLLDETALDSLQVTARIVYLFSNGVPILFLGLALVSLLAKRRKTTRLYLLAAGIVGLVLVANALIDLLAPSRFRYLMSLWPFLSLITALGFVALERYRRLFGVLLTAWLVVGVWNSATLSFAADQGNNGSDRLFRNHLVIRGLQTLGIEDDMVVYAVPDAFDLADNQNRANPYFDRLPVQMQFRDLGIIDEADALEDEYQTVLRQIGQQRLHLWVASMPDYPTSVLAEFERRLSARGYGMCEVINTEALSLTLYARSQACCFTGSAPARLFQFGDGIWIAAVDAPQEARDSLPIGLAWEIAPEIPDNVYSVSLQVFDSQENKIAQVDEGLDKWRFLCQPFEIPLDGLPPGDYQVRATVYEWQTQIPLPGLDLQTNVASNLLHIHNFKVN